MEKKEQSEKKPEKDPYTIVKHPLSTEKSIRLMESENKLIFVVSKNAAKNQIKQAVETLFKSKVIKVNTFVTQDGEKRAYVQFAMDTPAVDIATQLGLI
jgi:ribosomal protein uL23